MSSLTFVLPIQEVCIFFNVPLRNIIFIWRHHWTLEIWRKKIRPLLGAVNMIFKGGIFIVPHLLWQGVCFCRLNRKTAPCIRLYDKLVVVRTYCTPSHFETQFEWGNFEMHIYFKDRPVPCKSVELCNLRTFKHLDNRTLVLSNFKTIGPLNYRTIELSVRRNVGPSNCLAVKLLN